MYAVLVEQLVGQFGYCMRPCSISVCCAGGATGRADWLVHIWWYRYKADLTPIDALMSYVFFS